MEQLDGKDTSGKHSLQTSAGYLSAEPLRAHLLMRQDKRRYRLQHNKHAAPCSGRGCQLSVAFGRFRAHAILFHRFISHSVNALLWPCCSAAVGGPLPDDNLSCGVFVVMFLSSVCSASRKAGCPPPPRSLGN